MRGDVAITAAEVFQDEWGRVVATVIRDTGDWSLAEECTQDAFTLALERWRDDGIPDRPGAWLTTVARRRAIDRVRRNAIGDAKLHDIAMMSETAADGADGEPDGIDDERLRLMFTCCHPALAVDAQIALTLRMLGGLSTAEIARAFLVSEETMGKRLGRAKQKIRHAGIPFRVPPPQMLPTRIPPLLAVIYLLFNEGYSASSGAGLMRPELTREAIRLARVLAQLLPEEPEASGLLALMLLHDARRATRVDDVGDLVTLEDQERTLWDLAEVGEGVLFLERALEKGRAGAYQIQAAIAACHSTAARAADTDWAQIAALYGQLGRVAPSPVVELNRAVAVAMAHGPAAGLCLIDSLAESKRLNGYHLLHATRADLLRRLERHADAADAYRSAVELARCDTECRYLRRRLIETTARC
jgi:RNA polymerase sigma-70 factor (ECF subfamily)